MAITMKMLEEQRKLRETQMQICRWCGKTKEVGCSCDRTDFIIKFTDNNNQQRTLYIRYIDHENDIVYDDLDRLMCIISKDQIISNTHVSKYMWVDKANPAKSIKEEYKDILGGD